MLTFCSFHPYTPIYPNTKTRSYTIACYTVFHYLAWHEVNSWIWMNVSYIKVDICCRAELLLLCFLSQSCRSTCIVFWLLLCAFKSVCMSEERILSACLCAVSNSLCVSRWRKEGVSLQQGGHRMKWRKREGNDEGLLSETATLPLSCCLESWRSSHTHTHTVCCLCDYDKTTGSEKQESKHLENREKIGQGQRDGEEEVLQYSRWTDGGRDTSC